MSNQNEEFDKVGEAYPHRPAAFINAISEEGTKEEAVEWLQRIWNELCAAQEELSKANEAARNWYMAASPHASPEALRSALRRTRFCECPQEGQCLGMLSAGQVCKVQSHERESEPMGDAEETIERNPKSWAAWKRRAEQLEAQLSATTPSASGPQYPCAPTGRPCGGHCDFPDCQRPRDAAKTTSWVEVEKAKADAYEAAALICEEMSYPPEGCERWHGTDNEWAAIKLGDAAEAIRKRKAQACQVTQAVSDRCAK